MIKVTKEFTFDAAHRLMNHPGRCKNLHGHTYKVQVTLGAQEACIACNGMVADFGQIKEIVGCVLDHFDHALILDIGDPLLKALEGLDLKTVTMDGPPTAEAMSAFFGKEIARILPPGDVSLTSVRVWETPTSFAEYEGLPCQT